MLQLRESAMHRSKILLVDDSSTTRSILKVYLTGLDMEFLDAGQGDMALDVLRRNPVDLVIADFNMPVMDGITFLRHLRSSPSKTLRGLPVILLTSESVETAATQAGASAFVRKPVTNKDLRAAVLNLLPKS
jgi:two-component system chemotaxis response regulator CheY